MSTKVWEVVDGHYPGMLEIKGLSFTVSIVTSAIGLTLEDHIARVDDARLMAAAPDLLAALRKVMADVPGDDLDDWYTMATTAITKATGGDL